MRRRARDSAQPRQQRLQLRQHRVEHGGLRCGDGQGRVGHGSAQPRIGQPLRDGCRQRPGIADDRFYTFLQRTWMAHQIPIGIALYLLGGWPWVVWGVFVRVSACTTMHWFISYFAHTRGPQDWIVDGAVIQAHNVPLMAIPTMGESWHSNHHAFPSSARHGLYPGQIDLGWHFVRFLAWVGLARNVKVPTNLPPRPGITPVTARAMDVASPGQVAFSGHKA